MPDFFRRRRCANRHRSRGQAIVEFALVFPILMLLVGGIIQLGVIFWGQNTLNQVVRDTGRWAATQQNKCVTAAEKDAERVLVRATADTIAGASSLVGFDGSFDAADVTVDWSGDPCPPNDNSEEAWVTITIEHTVPVFFPVVPGGGAISSSTEFRMEPAPK